jgi:hypothetical protein
MKQNKVIRLTASLVGALTILACGVATQATPAPLLPTATPMIALPASTNTITPVPPTLEPEILYQDDFSSNANGWDIGEESADNGSTEANIVDGQYVLNMTAKSEYFGSVTYIPGFSGKDFVMSIDITILEDVPENLLLSFDVRGSGPKYYSFSFFNGASGLALTQDGKDDVTLWDWMTSSPIEFEKGVTKNFKFEANGPVLSLYVNDEKINSATDTTIDESGEIDFIIMLPDANETLSIAFDNLIIKSTE